MCSGTGATIKKTSGRECKPGESTGCRARSPSRAGPSMAMCPTCGADRRTGCPYTCASHKRGCCVKAGRSTVRRSRVTKCRRRRADSSQLPLRSGGGGSEQPQESLPGRCDRRDRGEQAERDAGRAGEQCPIFGPHERGVAGERRPRAEAADAVAGRAEVERPGQPAPRGGGKRIVAGGAIRAMEHVTEADRAVTQAGIVDASCHDRPSSWDIAATSTRASAAS